MSDAHAKDDGAVHAHVSSPLFYGAVFGALLTLTVTTVGQSYFDFGRLNLAIVVLIASMKAALVVSFFMHLRWDNRFNALMFISGLAFIGVFFAYTMNDTSDRGDLDPDQNVHVLPKTGEEAPGHFDKLAPAHSGSAAVPAPGGAAPAPAPEHH
jgi:cytochrome c oxidase subunit 4